MSKTRYKWWTYAKNVVRAYPELKEEYDAIRSQRITANLSGIPGNKDCARGTEISALKQLPPARQREYDAVTKAIELTKKYPNGDQRIKIIDLVYWKQTHKLDGAALQTHYGYGMARIFHQDFIRLVGFNMGLED